MTESPYQRQYRLRVEAEVEISRLKTAVEKASAALDGYERDPLRSAFVASVWLRTAFPTDHANYLTTKQAVKFSEPKSRCGKPIEDDGPCVLPAGHDNPCWPGHSWG